MTKVDRPLEHLVDRHGAITIGWLGERLLYARFERTISAGLGARFAARLTSLLAEVPLLDYFTDASGLESYDLSARSAIIQAMMVQRIRFNSVVTLTWGGGVGPIARRFAAALGVPVEYLTEQADFQARLREHGSVSISKLYANHGTSAFLTNR